MRQKLPILFAVLLLIAVIITVLLVNPFKKKAKAGLQVITNQESCSLFLDDQYLDKTPYINKKIQPGQYTLRIEPDNPELVPYETPVNLNPGTLTVVTWQPGPHSEASGGVIYEMEALADKKKAEISFITIPDNAIISFDNREKQFSPLVLTDIEPGHHQFAVSLPAFETQKHTINVVPGFRLKISVTLIKTNQAMEQADTTLETQEQSSEPEESSPDSGREKALEAADQPATPSGQASTQLGLVKIKSTNFFQQGVEVLRVRDQASASGQEVGFVQAQEQYPYLGETKNGWYYLKFTDALDDQAKQGWVSGQYSELITN